MKSFLVLCVAAALATGVCGDCDACLEGWCYKMHLLPGASGNPSGSPADIDRNTNTLYVIDEQQRIKECNLDTATCRDTVHPLKLYKVAVDQRTGDVYGTVRHGRGIYKVDFANNKMILLDPAARVWRMTFKDKLYYAHLNTGIYTSEGGKSRILAGTEAFDVLYFIIDNRNDIYFHDGYVRRLSAGVVSRTQFSDRDDFTWAVDKDGNAMFFDPVTDAVFRVTHDQSVEVGAVNDTSFNTDYVLFDRDNNLIVIEKDERYHLRKDSVRCTISRIGGQRIITESVVPSTVSPTESTTSGAAERGTSDSGVVRRY